MSSSCVAALLESGERAGADRQVADAGQAAGALAGLVRRGVVERPGDVDRLVVVRRVVVVGAVDVGGHQRQRHALLVGVGEGAARELGVGEPADGALDDAGAVVGGVDDAHRVVVGRHDEGVPDPQRHDLAVGAHADAVGPVVGRARGLGGAPGAVAARRAAARGVVRVVVVVEEVPAGDVVDVAVGVGVGVVGEGRDQVRGVEERVGLLVAGGVADARVVPVIGDVEGAVAVAVVGTAGGAAVPGQRQLLAVQANLLDELAGLPADPRIEDRDRRPGVAGRVLPGGVGANAGDLRALGVARGDVGGATLRVELVAVQVLRAARADAGAWFAESGLKPKARNSSSA